VHNKFNSIYAKKENEKRSNSIMKSENNEGYGFAPCELKSTEIGRTESAILASWEKNALKSASTEGAGLMTKHITVTLPKY